MIDKNGASAAHGAAARAAIDKLYQHATAQHGVIHHLEDEVVKLHGVLGDLAEGRLFVSRGGQA
jgi:hypothetical protein